MLIKKKILIGLGVLAVFSVGAVLVINGLWQVGNNQGYEPDQPIAFSHKLHVGDNEMQCLYCHSGAEKSRHAGVPAANTCLNCHSNIRKDAPDIVKIKKAVDENKIIEWVKVNRLQDFVYFNHAQHVALGKVSCQTCHGPVETMTRMRQDKNFSMGWCIECHRQSDVVGHKKQVVKESDIGGTDCAKCHY